MLDDRESVAMTRLDRYIVPEPMSGCFLWDGAAGSNGYGQLRVGTRVFYAHRLSFTRARGAIPDGLHVLHRCDVPSCVNPAHLFLGTNADNIADMRAKGRQHVQSKRKACLHGYPFTPENTRVTPAGQQSCRECARLRMQRRSETAHGKEYAAARNTQAAAKRAATPWVRKPRAAARHLTPEQVQEVQRLAGTMSLNQIAAQVGSSRSTIHRIVRAALGAREDAA